jgi:nucleoside-diphosphate-sugar epimerase
MRLLITGGTGVLGCALRPVAEDAGHELEMPGHEELDLFDASAVADAVRDVDGVVHLATRIRSLDQISDPDAWRENDRLRADASRILVDAAIAAGAQVYVQPTVTFVYPADAEVSEDTPKPMGDFGATLHVGDAGRALLSALSLPSGIYNVCRDGERVSAERFTQAAGWHPRQ